MQTLEERLIKHSKSEPETGCLLWTGALYTNGYGAIRTGRTTRLTHRAAYELWVGEIPQGLCVLHKCDVRSCISPKHLFLGTNKDNMQDCLNKGRFATGDRHGFRLHPEKMNPARGNKHRSHTHPEKTPRGEQHWHAKLTTEKVLEIRSRTRESQINLAEEFGLARETVNRIINRKSWRCMC